MKSRNVLVLAFASAALPFAALAGGGTVIKLDGRASIDRKGNPVDVSESTPIFSGDVLSVSDKASAQLRFEDDSVFVVPGAARFRVDTFSLPTLTSGGKAIYTLLDGGVRTITGSVSKGDKDQYELRTEEATVTVQGSAYSALRCTGACAKKYKPGLYVKGESGTITVATNAGSLKVHRGQVVIAPNKSSIPVHVKVSPFNDPIVAATFKIDVELEAEVHPPRIEQEPAASPS
ncbi:MAG TPA: hypothetical protein VM240_08115 [Verrucomicrobiae bacterium]|nr:hypothetical protein [Verrucomicrobiae bacterium]